MQIVTNRLVFEIATEYYKIGHMYLNKIYTVSYIVLMTISRQYNSSQ